MLPELPNPFFKPVESYTRDLDIVGGALNDYAKFIQLNTGDPFEQCLEFAKTALRPGGVYELNNPRTLVLDKDMNGDRKKKETTFMGFLNRVQKQNLLLSPSLTAYLPESVRQSTHSIYIAEGVKNRKNVKHEQMRAEGNFEFERAAVLKGEQENFKINNNSYSGATVSAATILYYKSTHSSLTSTCRTATSYANANNEKFITGNRHYYNPEVTKINLTSIINLTDMVMLQQAMDTYGLVYPTAQDVVDMVLYSTKHYWTNPRQTARILHMCEGMSPLERAAVMYVGDMYHLNKHNPVVARAFLQGLAKVGTPDQHIPESEYKTLDGDTKMLAHFICYDLVRGRNNEKLEAENPEVFDVIHATGGNVVATLQEYKLLIESLFTTKNIPSSIHAFPSAYRRAAVISDTDSTMFTLQYWVEEIYGRVCFTPEAKRLVFGLVFLVSQTVAHILAIQSANMGVAGDKLRLLSMKNEFYFQVLSLTTRSKHYYASQDAVEGVMFEVSRMEVKGVGLRDSKVPPKINKTAKKMMEQIIFSVRDEIPLDLFAMLKEIADLEREIIMSIRSGKSEYLTTGQVKGISSYKSEDNATYRQYEAWRDVWAPKTGHLPAPPYTFVKVSMTTHNKTGIAAWIETIEDKALAQRLRQWIIDTKKTCITNIHVPSSVVENMGIPDEIARVADVRTIISNTMGVFYLIMESLGIYLQDKDNTRLISDFY